MFAYLAKAAKKLSLLVQYITLICGVNKMLYIETYCPNVGFMRCKKSNTLGIYGSLHQCAWDYGETFDFDSIWVSSSVSYATFLV